MSAESAYTFKENKSYKELSLNRRSYERTNLYKGDFYDVNVEIENEIVFKNANIIDFSANGIGLVHPSFNKGLVGKKLKVKLAADSKFFLYGKILYFTTSKFSGKSYPRIGVQFKSTIEKDIDNLKNKFFTTDKLFKASAKCLSPFRYYQTNRYSISHFYNEGFVLEAKDPMFILVPGMVLDFCINIPENSETRLEATVIDISLDSEQQCYRIICKYQFIDFNLSKSISSYLLTNTERLYSLNELRDNGFIVDNIKEKLVFKYVSTKEEWQKILSLRLKTAQLEGRWLEETDPQKMIDDYDHNSRHLYCEIGKVIVGSTRMTFNDGEREKSEHSQHVDLPQFLFDKGFVECSRLNTDPDYRGANIFLNMLKECLRIAINGEYQYIVINCEDSLIPIYERFGANFIGLSFTNKYMNGKRLNVCYFDVNQLLTAKKMNPIYWYLITNDTRLKYKESLYKDFSLIEKYRVKIIETVAKISLSYLNHKKKKKLIKKYFRSLL